MNGEKRELMRDVDYWVGSVMIVGGIVGAYGGYRAIEAGELNGLFILVPCLAIGILGACMNITKLRIDRKK